MKYKTLKQMFEDGGGMNSLDSYTGYTEEIINPPYDVWKSKILGSLAPGETKTEDEMVLQHEKLRYYFDGYPKEVGDKCIMVGIWEKPEEAKLQTIPVRRLDHYSETSIVDMTRSKYPGVIFIALKYTDMYEKIRTFNETMNIQP